MDTLQMQTSHLTKNDDEATHQQQIVKDFFLKDSGSEMIESLNMLIETLLFTESLTRITPEMREHIVNQLRVASLIAKLDSSNHELANARNQLAK